MLLPFLKQTGELSVIWKTMILTWSQCTIIVMYVILRVIRPRYNDISLQLRSKYILSVSKYIDLPCIRYLKKKNFKRKSVLDSIHLAWCLMWSPYSLTLCKNDDVDNLKCFVLLAVTLMSIFVIFAGNMWIGTVRNEPCNFTFWHMMHSRKNLPCCLIEYTSIFASLCWRQPVKIVCLNSLRTSDAYMRQ